MRIKIIVIVSIAFLFLLGTNHPVFATDKELCSYVVIPSFNNGEMLEFVFLCKMIKDSDVAKYKNEKLFSVWRCVSFLGYKESKKNTDSKHFAMDQNETNPLGDLENIINAEFEEIASNFKTPILVKPLLRRTQTSQAWFNTTELNVLVESNNMSEYDRKKLMSSCLFSALDMSSARPAVKDNGDPAEILRAYLSEFGTESKQVIYLSKYNVFLIRADAKYAEHAETLLSAMGSSTTSGHRVLGTSGK